MICPIHGTEMYHGPHTGLDACQDINCPLGHGAFYDATRRCWRYKCPATPEETTP